MSRPSPSEDLERVQVLDLTRVRARPTVVRHDPISETCTATSAASGSI
jgi:hypothetical protein